MSYRTMTLEAVGRPLVMTEHADLRPGDNEIAIAVEACGVCRTDLHICDGELADGGLPRVLGHQIVGTVTALGAQVHGLSIGMRVGVPWLGSACGVCDECRGGHENLCKQAQFTGYQRDGGFAERCLARADFAIAIPVDYTAIEAAPLLCGAAIGFRALRLAGNGKRLGLYGFGSAAHQITQIARYQEREVFAFTRPGDERTQAFARGLGVTWAGGSDDKPPVELDAAIIFASVGELVPRALTAVKAGGVVVCAGIHMSDIPSFPYRLLWGERVLRSVANLTRHDARELLALAPAVGLRPTVTTYALADANRALEDLRGGRFDGSAVLVMRCPIVGYGSPPR